MIELIETELQTVAYEVAMSEHPALRDVQRLEELARQLLVRMAYNTRRQ